MLILSKYKDYYDYLTGIYGIDNHIVLDRTKGRDINYLDGKYTVYICGIVVEGYRKDGKFYWGEELKLIAEQAKYFPDRYFVKNSLNRYEPVELNSYEDKHNLNSKYGCPIMITRWPVEACLDSDGYLEDYPYLKLIDFNKVFPPEKIYNMLYNWISTEIASKENKEIKLTDVQKLESKGFDKVTSFRNVK